jgi:hypothetical protein
MMPTSIATGRHALSAITFSRTSSGLRAGFNFLVSVT